MPYIKPTTQKPLQTDGERLISNKIRNDPTTPPSGKVANNGIKEIVIIKKTVLHLFPNGEVYIQKHLCQEWIQGMNQIYKAKAKAKDEKKKDLEEIKIVEGESY